jgi:hypothetical protein
VGGVLATSVAAAGPAQPDFAEMDSFVQTTMHDRGIPGVALAVIHDDQIVHLRGFGVADPSGRAVTPEPVTITYQTPTPPADEVTAQITGCSAQEADVYACALQVRLGPALPVHTVFSVDIGGASFANPGGRDRPEVTSSQGCDNRPNPSPYLASGDHYTHYDVNISTGGCQAGADVTFREEVAGTAGSTITQAVKVPGFKGATATFVLPSADR